MGMLDGLFDFGKVVSGFIPGVGGLISAGLGGLQSAYDTQTASDASAAQQRLQDTTMQRRVADYQAAGLAPQLAAGGGGGISQPIQASSGQDLAGDAMAAYNKQQTAQAADLMQHTVIDHTQAQADLIRQQISASKSDEERKDKGIKDQEDQNAAKNIYQQAMADAAGRRGTGALYSGEAALQTAGQKQEALPGEINATAMAAARDKMLADLTAKNIPLAEAQTRVANAMGNIQGDISKQSAANQSVYDKFLSWGVAPMTLNMINDVLKGALKLIHVSQD